MDEKPDWTDAEFEVVQEPEERLPWWRRYRIVFDWRVFAVIFVTALAQFIASLRH